MTLTPTSMTPSSPLQSSEDLTPEDWQFLLATQPTVWLEAITELEGEPTQLEPYQIRFLNDRSTYRIVNKARQIGFSTVIAMEAVHAAATRQNYKANYISINQEEASDKITIARNLYHSIPDELKESDMKPSLYTDSSFELSFHYPPRVSTLHSQPASAAIRGGKKDIYFDEFAHIRDAGKLYQAALPAISRGEGRMTVISTPLGQSGLFYDIWTGEKEYPYSRHAVPWWEYTGYVKEGAYAEALAMAPTMDTVQRLNTYARGKIVEIFAGFGGDIQQFQTEYEATFVDELSSFYPWSLIVENVDDNLGIWKSLPPGWEPEGFVSIGIDLAKTKDESVFTVVEHIEDGDEVHRYVRYVHATQDDYDSQWRFIKSLIKRTKASRVTIDQTGLGQVFVETSKKDPEVDGSVSIEGVVFTNPKKEKWATQFKSDLQTNSVHYPRIPDLLKQIHGITRVKSEAGFYKFSGKKDDYFWSLCLALYGEGRIAPRLTAL